MRKLIIFNMITLDGFFEGPNKELDWHHVDGEFNEFAINQLNSVDAILFGRVTYQLMESYWPTEQAIKDDHKVAELMNTKPKIVFSRTLDKADWKNTRLVKGNTAQEISRLKTEPGKDLIILGSADFASLLTGLGLIDEYRVIVNPVALGKGSPLFKNLDKKLDLKLLKTEVFKSGNVLLCYAPKADKI